MKLHQPVTRCGVLGLDETLRVLVGLAEGRAGKAGLTAPPRLEVQTDLRAEESEEEGRDGGQQEPVS